jgi:hypothetical protein
LFYLPAKLNFFIILTGLKSAQNMFFNLDFTYDKPIKMSEGDFINYRETTPMPIMKWFPDLISFGDYGLLFGFFNSVFKI